MPFPAESLEFCEYFSGSQAITCLVVCRSAQLCFVRFRTADWGPDYPGYGLYSTVGLFAEHLRPADPQSPGVLSFAQALAAEAATQQQHAFNCRRQANGQEAREAGIHTSKSKPENGQGAPSPRIAKSPSPPAAAEKLPASQPEASKGKLNGKEFSGRSLTPIKSIAGLTLADFIGARL
jgi:hypothetical protein